MALFGLFRPPDLAKLEASRDVPALVKLVHTHEDWIMRRDAMLAVHRIGGPDVPPLLIEVLERDEYWKNREIAAQLLGELGDPAGLDPLMGATRDAYIDVRWMAVRALSDLYEGLRSGPPEAPVVHVFVTRLNDSAWWVRQSAAHALERLAQPEFLEQLQPAIKPLHRTLQDEVRAVRQAALNVLIRLNAPPTIESLVMALKDVAWSVRLSAAEALETLGWTPDRDQEIAYWIARGEPGRCVSRGIEAVPALVWVLDDQYLPLVADVIDALVRIGTPAVPALLEGLQHKDWWAREAAARALGRIGSPRAVVPLIERLSDRSYNVREASIRALGALGDPRAVPYVAALARHDSHHEVRSAAGEVLRVLPEPRR